MGSRRLKRSGVGEDSVLKIIITACYDDHSKLFCYYFDENN